MRITSKGDLGKMTDKIGVCILNWNGLKYTALCLLSLFKQDYVSQGGEIEILTLDQGSTDGSLKLLRDAQKSGLIKLVEEDKNIGFSSGNNKLTKLALEEGCKYILLLNNDTRAFPDMVSTMVKCFEDNKDCGACGVAAYEYNHGKVSDKECKRIWGIGGWFRRDDSMTQIDGFGFGWSDNHIRKCAKCGAALQINLQEPSNVKCNSCGWYPYDELYINCDYVGGGCLMTTKEVIDKVGMFDIKFDPLYEEDTDLCLRMKELGYKIIHINKSGFHHAVSAFTSGYKRGRFWEIHQKNKAYWMTKWEDKLRKGVV